MKAILKPALPAIALGLVSVIAAYGATYLPAQQPMMEIAGVEEATTKARERFADAPHGVDPMTTGPVSAAFAERQDALGCANAEWPDIPVACYPD